MKWFLSIPGMILLGVLLLVGVGTAIGVAWELGDVLTQNVHTHAVQQSQGYIEAQNQACAEDHLEWEQATAQHQPGLAAASLQDCRSHLVGIDRSEIQPDVLNWLLANGGV